MNKKLIAGLAAITLFCASVPVYSAFLNASSISVGAEEADIAAFLKGYTSMDNKVSIAGDIPIAGRTYAQGIQFSGYSTPEAFLKRSFDYTYNTSTKTIAYSKSDQASGFSMNGRSYYTTRYCKSE